GDGRGQANPLLSRPRGRDKNTAPRAEQVSVETHPGSKYLKRLGSVRVTRDGTENCGADAIRASRGRWSPEFSGRSARSQSGSPALARQWRRMCGVMPTIGGYDERASETSSSQTPSVTSALPADVVRSARLLVWPHGKYMHPVVVALDLIRR